jgi:hypothetical protein
MPLRVRVGFESHGGDMNASRFAESTLAWGEELQGGSTASLGPFSSMRNRWKFTQSLIHTHQMT